MGYLGTSLRKGFQALVRERLGGAFTCHCGEGVVLIHLFAEGEGKGDREGQVAHARQWG